MSLVMKTCKGHSSQYACDKWLGCFHAHVLHILTFLNVLVQCFFFLSFYSPELFYLSSSEYNGDTLYFVNVSFMLLVPNLNELYAVNLS